MSLVWIWVRILGNGQMPEIYPERLADLYGMEPDRGPFRFDLPLEVVDCDCKDAGNFHYDDSALDNLVDGGVYPYGHVGVDDADLKLIGKRRVADADVPMVIQRMAQLVRRHHRENVWTGFSQQKSNKLAASGWHEVNVSGLSVRVRPEQPASNSRFTCRHCPSGLVAVEEVTAQTLPVWTVHTERVRELFDFGAVSLDSAETAKPVAVQAVARGWSLTTAQSVCESKNWPSAKQVDGVDEELHEAALKRMMAAYELPAAVAKDVLARKLAEGIA